MEERTKKVLEFLEPYGTGEYVNISPVISGFFPVEDVHNNGEMRIACKKVWDFVYGLRSAKIIRLRERNITGLGSGNITGGFAWLDTIPIDAAIEPEGELQLAFERAKSEDNELRSSTLLTNIAVQRMTTITEANIKTQANQSRTALWIAGAAAFLALAGLIKDVLKHDKQPIIQVQVQDSILKNRTLETKPVPSTLYKTGENLKDSVTDTGTKVVKPKL